MSENVRKELQDFASGEGIYDLPAWMNNSPELFDLFLSRNIVIPRSELPAVKRNFTDSDTYSTDGESILFTSAENARAWVMRDIAVWQFIEHEASELAKKEAEKNAARDKRRDELAAEFTAVNSYSGQLPYTQNLINRIIDLEAASNV